MKGAQLSACQWEPQVSILKADLDPKEEWRTGWGIEGWEEEALRATERGGQGTGRDSLHDFPPPTQPFWPRRWEHTAAAWRCLSKASSEHSQHSLGSAPSGHALQPSGSLTGSAGWGCFPPDSEPILGQRGSQPLRRPVPGHMQEERPG